MSAYYAASREYDPSPEEVDEVMDPDCRGGFMNTKTWTLRNTDGGFMGHIHAQELEIPTDEHGCFFFHTDGRSVVGLASRKLGIRIFDKDGVEVLPLLMRPPVGIEALAQEDVHA